ncbi:hypothetical protein [Flavobacterium sp. ACAM 123]|uniref:hypothetical protein n=1 Tax=Flavobacterium sp. ACAM 123 TaxID=1189620 RepID=UPI0002DB479D|nr:hypothetical protein [Flavobacterium sp. ACAM 123]
MLQIKEVAHEKKYLKKGEGRSDDINAKLEDALKSATNTFDDLKSKSDKIVDQSITDFSKTKNDLKTT